MGTSECESLASSPFSRRGSDALLNRVLFVKPKKELTPEVIKRIRSGIAVALSSRHVPAKVIHRSEEHTSELQSQ